MVALVQLIIQGAYQGSPLHKENRENGSTGNLEIVKIQGILPKSHGIICALVLNSLVQKVKDIVLFVPKKNSQEVKVSPSELSLCNILKSQTMAQGDCVVRQGRNSKFLNKI